MKTTTKIGERILIERNDGEIIIISKVRYTSLFGTIGGILFFIFIIPFIPAMCILALIFVFQIFRVEKIILNKEKEYIEKSIQIINYKVKSSFEISEFKELYFFLKMTSDFATDVTSDLYSIYLKKNGVKYHFLTLDREKTYLVLKELLLALGIKEFKSK